MLGHLNLKNRFRLLKNLPNFFCRISEELYKEELIKEEDKIRIMKALLLRHRHVNEHHDRGFKFSNKKQSYPSLQVCFLNKLYFYSK